MLYLIPKTQEEEEEEGENKIPTESMIYSAKPAVSLNSTRAIVSMRAVRVNQSSIIAGWAALSNMWEQNGEKVAQMSKVSFLSLDFSVWFTILMWHTPVPENCDY